jgi:hypothetical protein
MLELRGRSWERSLIALLILGTLCVSVTRGEAATRPPQARPATVFLSPLGSDADACTRARPCQSFGAAYRRAAPGDTVEVAGGSYPAQLIRADAAKRSADRVVFQPAAGALVTIEGSLDLGQDQYRVPAPRNVVIRRIRVTNEIRIWSGALGITIENMDANNFLIVNSKNVLVKGGDFGPCRAGPGVSCVSKIAGSDAEDIVIEDALFHDITSSNPALYHIECMFIRAGRKITIRRNTFRNCEVFDLFLQGQPETQRLVDIVIEKNWFDAPLRGDGGRRDTAIEFSGDRPFEDVRIVRNSFVRSNVSVRPRGAAISESDIRLTANVLEQRAGKCGGAQFQRNIWVDGRQCSNSDRKPPFGYLARDGALVADGGSAAAVREVFRMAIKRIAPIRIAARLSSRRLARPAGQRWTARFVRDLLRDRTYVGATYGARGAHPALVGERTWRLAQRALASK